MINRFSKHAEDKFTILERHQFNVTKEEVLDTAEKPDALDRSRYPLIFAQKTIDETHVLRVVYKIEGGIKVIITFYPGRP